MSRKAMLSSLIICTAPLGSLNASAEQWSPPSPEQRCPSQWGANDERGAANHMKPQTVLKGIRLIKDGKMYELGRVLESDMPNFGTRHYAIHTARSFKPPSANRLLGTEEKGGTGSTVAPIAIK
jgi:hypothetical protein